MLKFEQLPLQVDSGPKQHPIQKLKPKSYRSTVPQTDGRAAHKEAQNNSIQQAEIRSSFSAAIEDQELMLN